MTIAAKKMDVQRSNDNAGSQMVGLSRISVSFPASENSPQITLNFSLAVHSKRYKNEDADRRHQHHGWQVEEAPPVSVCTEFRGGGYTKASQRSYVPVCIMAHPAI